MASPMVEREIGGKLIHIEVVGTLKNPSVHMSEAMLSDFLEALNHKQDSVVKSKSHGLIPNHD